MGFFSLRKLLLPFSFLVKRKKQRVRNILKKPSLENLEDLTLPATLDLVGGRLVFTGTGATANVITISFPTDTISVQDTQETITLGSGATSAGWTSTSAIKVTGPSSSVTSLKITGGSSGSDSLTITDSGDTNVHSYLLDSGTIQRDSIPYSFSAIGTLSVTGGNGVNTFTVKGIGNNTTKLTGGTSNDIFTLGNSSNSLDSITAGKLTITGGSNNTTVKVTAAAGTQVEAQVVVGDTLEFLDQGDGGDNTYSLTSNLTRNSSVISTFSGIETLTLNASTGNNSINLGPTSGVTHPTINANSLATTSSSIRVSRSLSGSITELNGGVGNDEFIIGDTGNVVSSIAGPVSVKGGGHTAATTTVAAGTQVETTVTIGDTLRILDSGFNGAVLYGVGTRLVSTSGIGGMAYDEIQTLSISPATGNSTVNVGTKTLPTGNGTGSNPLGGVPNVTHLIVVGTSTATTKNTINVASTISGGISELNGGLGNDVFNLGSDPTNSSSKTVANIAGSISVDGASHTTATATAANGTQVATTVLVGNTVNLIDSTATGDFSYGIGAALLTRTGVAPIAYKNTETITVSTTTGNSTVELGAKTLPASTPAPVNLNGGAASADRVTITANSTASTVGIVNVRRTGAATLASEFATEITLGAGNDQVNLGNESNSLSELASVLSLNGGANLSTTQVISSGTLAEATVVSGDLIRIKDQGDDEAHDYGFGAALITRTGVAGIAYSKFETIDLSSSTGADSIQVGPATLPPATPAPVTLSGGAPTVNALLLQGNSLVGAGDHFELTATLATTATALTGGAGKDLFSIVSSPGLGVSIVGGSPTTSPGDTLEFDAAGESVTYLPCGIQGGTNQIVAYGDVETFTAATNTNGTVNLQGVAGDDEVVVSKNAGTLQFVTGGLTFPLSNSTTQFNYLGEGGTDRISVDYSGGGIPFNISVDATGGTNSLLSLTGNGTSTTAVYQPDSATPGSGLFTMDGSQKIQFKGLAPVDATGMNKLTVLLPNANNVIGVDPGLDFATKTHQALRISGTTGGVAFETLAAFGNTSLAIDTTTNQGDDKITITNADNAHGNTNFAISAGTGADSLSVNSKFVLDGNLDLQSGGVIGLNGSSIQTGGSQIFSGSVSTAPGAVGLTSTTNAAIAPNGDLNPGGTGVLGTIGFNTSKNVALGANKLFMDLDGVNGSDLVSNTGGIDLTGSTLTLNLVSSKSGTLYTIVQSTAGTIVGTFAGLPDGSTISVGGKTFKIHYDTKSVTLDESGGPSITSPDHTTFKMGSAGSFTVTATGTPTPTLSETGALPSGVTFVDNGDGTATLSGTPADGTLGNYSFTITAANGQIPDATQKFTLTVGQAPTISSVDTTTFTVGSIGAFTIQSTGFPVAALSETGALPSGVSFVDNGDGTASLGGTPEPGTGGSYSISLSASNGVLPNATQNFTLIINQAPAITSLDHTTFQTGKAGTFSFMASGYPVSFTYSTSGVLPSGVSLSPAGTLSGTPDSGTGGQYHFTVIATNGVSPDATQDFTLTVNQAPAITSADTTTFKVGLAGSFTVTTTGFPTATIGRDGLLPAGLTFVDNGDGTGTLSGTPDAATGGSYSLGFTATNGVDPDAIQNFTLVVNQAPSITSLDHTTFQTGEAGTFSFASSGYPTSFTYSTTGVLPSGVTLSPEGVLSGTPESGTGGTYLFSVISSNGISPDASQNFTLTVNQAPAITSSDTTTFTVGAAGSFTINTTGFPISVLSETGALPTGVTFVDNGDGTASLSGTPDAGTGGVYPITVKAANGITPDATQNFTLVINQAPAFTNVDNTTFKVGSAGTFQYTISGYPTTATYSTTGTLPSGVTLGTDGKLSGTPAVGTGGQYQFTVIASNGVNPDATQNFTLTVNEAPTITSADQTTFSAGLSGNFQFVSAGYPTTFTYSKVLGTLPTGVTLSPTGLLSGTPAANVSGDFPITVQSANGIEPDATQNFVLHVNPAGGIYFYDQVAKTLKIRLSDNVHLDMSELGGVVSFTVTKNGGTVILAAEPGSDVLSGNGTSTVTVDALGISTSVTINNAFSTTTGTNNPFSFTSGKVSTGAFNVDLGSNKGTGGIQFATTSELNLIGTLDVKANANVTIGGNLIANSAKFQFQDNAYDLALTGSTTVLTSATFGNGQQITLGDEATDTITIQNGVDTLADTATNLGGTINTNSTPINMTAVKLLANTILDTRGGGAGSSISLSGGLTQNGFTLTTYAAPDKTTTVTGTLDITDPFTAVTGGIVFGDGITPTTITFSGDSTLTSLTGGIGFGDKTSVVTGPSKVVFVSDNITIDPNTTFTGTGTLGFSPANSGINTYLGDAANTPLPGLKFPQSTLNQFPDTYTNIQFGQEGYDGLITVGTTNSNNPITLINNGGGGKVHIDGKFTINGADAAGNGLVIIGSGHTTVINADIVTAGADIIIDDAVQLDATALLDTTNGGAVPAGADVIITGGSAGIYATKGETNDLSIKAGTAGKVTLGAFKGFGNNSSQASYVNKLTVTADQILLPLSANQFTGDVSLNLTPAGTALFDSTLTTAGGLFVNNGASWKFTGALNITGSVIQLGTTKVTAGANILAGKGALLQGPLVLSADSTINAEGIHLTTVDGAGYNLTLNGNPNGTRSVIGVTGIIGNLNSLTIEGSESVNLAKAVTVNSLTLADMKAATQVVFVDNLAVAGTLTTSTDAFAVSLLGSKNTLGSANLGNTDSFTFGDGDNDATTITGSLSRTSPTLIQGSLTSGGDLSLGGVSSTTANGKMTLTANSVTLGNFGATTPSDLVIAANGPVIAGSLTAKTLNLTGATTINQTGGWVVSGQSNITGTGAVILDSNANKFTTLGISGTVISVNNSVGLVLSGAKTINNLSVNTSGDLTQTGALSVGGASSFTAVGSVTLADPTNSFVGAVSAKGTNISLFNNRDLTLGTVSGTGNLTFDTSAANGNITQAGTLSSTFGTVTINAGTGSVVLDNALNNFASFGPLLLNAANATIVVQGSLLIGTSSIAQNLDITAPGGLNQNNAITVGSHVRVESSGQVNLPSSNNSFPSLQITRGQSSLIVTKGALALDGIYLTSALTLIPGGNVTQTGPVQVAGAGAQTQIIAGGFDVTLPDLRNDSITMTVTAKRTEIADANHLTLLNSNVGDLFLTTGQTANLNTNTVNGSATISSGLDIRGGGNTFTSDTHLNANQNIHLDSDLNTFGTTVDFSATDVSIQAKGDAKIRFGTASGSLAFSSTGSITQSTAGTDHIEVVGPATISAGNDIQLNVATNKFQGPLALSGKNISVTNSVATTLGTTTATGDLSIIAKGFGISQNGNISAPGKASFDAGTGDILLGGNNTISQVSLTGNKITFATGSAVVVNALNTTSDVSLSAPAGFTFPNDLTGVNKLSISNLNADSSFKGVLSANQLVVLSGSGAGTLTVEGNTNLAGGLTAGKGTYNLNLKGASNTIGPVSLLNDGSLNLGDSKADQTLFTGSAALAAPGLSVVLQGTVISKGDLTLFGWKSGNATEPITLTANNIYLFGGTSLGGLNLNAIGEVNIQGDINSGNTTINTGTDLNLASTLNVQGDLIFQGGSLSVRTGNLIVLGNSALAARGDIFLNSADLKGFVQFQGRNVEINNDETLDLSVWNPNVPPAKINSAFGNLVLFVVDGDIVGTSPVSAQGTSSFTSVVGDIDLGNKSSLVGPVKFSGGNVTIRNTDNLIIAGGIAKGSLDLRTTAIDDTLTQTGPIQVQDGTTTIDVGSGILLLDNPLNDFGNKGALNVKAAKATIVDTNTLELGAVNVTRNFTVQAGGAITQSGVFNAGSSDFTSPGAITLEDPANTFGPLTLKSQSAAIVSSGAQILAGVNVSNGFSLNAGGDISQTGSVVNTGPAAMASFVSTGNVSLGGSGNDLVNVSFNANQVDLTTVGSVRILDSKIAGFAKFISGGDLSVGKNSFGSDATLVASRKIQSTDTSTYGGYLKFSGTDVSINSKDLRISNGLASGNLSLQVGGSLSQLGGPIDVLQVNGATNITADSNITLDANTNTLQGPISLSTVADVFLQNQFATTLGKIQSNVLTVIASGFGISQNSSITANGYTTFDAGTADILLGGPNTIALAHLKGNDITFHTTGAMTLDGVTARGNVNLSSGGSLTAFGSPFLINGFTTLNSVDSIDVVDGGSNFGRAVSATSSKGSITLDSGSNLITETISSPTKVNLNSAGNLIMQGPISGTDITLRGSGKASVLSGTVTANNLAWSGPGNLTFSGVQQLQSNFKVAGGQVRTLGNNLIQNSATLEVLDNALFNLDGHVQTFNGLNGAGSVSLGSLANAGSLFLENAADALFSGVISGEGTLFKTGISKQTLTGANTFKGDTRIQEGTLQLGDTVKNGSVAGTIYVGDAVLAFRPGLDQKVTNPIVSLDQTTPDVGLITLETPASAILTIAGKNQFVGKTNILEGTLNLTSNLANTTLNGSKATLTGTGTISGNLNALLGTIAPGNVDGTGKLNVTGEAVLTAQSTLLIGLASNSVYGLLNAGKTTLQNGNLVVKVASGYTPPDLQTYTVLQANPTVTGQFAQKTVVFSDPYYFKATYNTNTVVLQKVPSGVLPGATPLIVAPASGISQAVIYNSSNQVRAKIQPMGSWTGGMRTAVGDINGDGWADYIFAAGAGGSPRVVVIDGVTLKTVSSFFAYSPSFTGGLYVAVGDIHGNGQTEIITGAGAGGGPHVQAFDGTGKSTGTSFFAYSPSFTGGVTVATGDLDGDGTAEIITGAASHGGSHVQSFHANGTNAGLSFFAYASSFLGGVNVAAGDLDGDGKAEIITGPGFTGAPNLKVFSNQGTTLSSIYTTLPSFTGGLTVGAINPTNGSKFQVVTAPMTYASTYPGPRVFNYDLDAGTLVFVTSILAYPQGYYGGIWVA